MKNMKVIVITSGGMDSTTLLYYHLAIGDQVRALGVNYGQRHRKELNFASMICEELGVDFKVAMLNGLRDILPGSSQTSLDVPVPEGHYSEENMKATVVPNRNMILLAVAIGHAIAHQYDAVSYAAHAGDHAIYPDCRPEFVTALQAAANICDWRPIMILRPFIHYSKADIVQEGHGRGVPFEKTWSCYQGRERHCGRCGTCVERREAFHLACVKDPTPYEPTAPTVQEMVERNWHL